jgi:hypothetical protein
VKPDPITIGAVTLTANDQGVLLSTWVGEDQISVDDAVKIRDWLNLAFPTVLPPMSTDAVISNG